MKKVLSSILFIFLIFFYSCGNNRQQTSAVPNTDTMKANDSMLSKNLLNNKNGYFIIHDDSLEIPAFEIEVRLTDKAEQKLKKDKESIIVSAYFSGTPKDTTGSKYVEDGEYSIASAEKELFGERIATFKNIQFSKAIFDSLADKNIQVLINVYSGRRSGPDNILDCTILQDTLSNVKGKRFTIKGKLIGETGAPE